MRLAVSTMALIAHKVQRPALSSTVLMFRDKDKTGDKASFIQTTDPKTCEENCNCEAVALFI